MRKVQPKSSTLNAPTLITTPLNLDFKKEDSLVVDEDPEFRNLESRFMEADLKAARAKELLKNPKKINFLESSRFSCSPRNKLTNRANNQT